MANTASDFLKVPEAAKALGVSERTIRSWIATGHLPRIQPGGEHGAIRIDRRDLLRSERREVNDDHRDGSGSPPQHPAQELRGRNVDAHTGLGVPRSPDRPRGTASSRARSGPASRPAFARATAR